MTTPDDNLYADAQNGWLELIQLQDSHPASGQGRSIGSDKYHVFKGAGAKAPSVPSALSVHSLFVYWRLFALHALPPTHPPCTSFPPPPPRTRTPPLSPSVLLLLFISDPISIIVGPDVRPRCDRQHVPHPEWRAIFVVTRQRDGEISALPP